MSMTDPIADFLARLRNGIHARKQTIECPRSNIKVRIAEEKGVYRYPAEDHKAEDPWGDGFPMRTRAQAARPAPPDYDAERFVYDEQAVAYEYLLTRNEPPGLFSTRADLERVAEKGAWRLWRRRP